MVPPDVTLRLLKQQEQDGTQEPHSKRLCTGSEHALAELKVHSLVLDTHSEYFQALLARWAPEAPLSSPQKAGSKASIVLDVNLAEEDVAAFKAMLQHMEHLVISTNPDRASNKTPLDQLDQTGLVRFLVLCDKYGCPACARDAAVALGKLSKNDLQWGTVIAVYTIALSQQGIEEVRKVARTKLQSMFWDLEAVMRDEDRLQLLLALPIQAVLELLSSPWVRAALEDTIALAACLWLSKQTCPPSLADTHALFSLLRVDQLTTGFCTGLAPFIPELWAYFTNPVRVSGFMFVKSHQQESATSSLWDSVRRQVTTGSSRRSVAHTLVVTCQVSASDLVKAVHCARHASPTCTTEHLVCHSQPAFFAGWMWTLRVRVVRKWFEVALAATPMKIDGVQFPRVTVPLAINATVWIGSTSDAPVSLGFCTPFPSNQWTEPSTGLLPPLDKLSSLLKNRALVCEANIFGA